MKGNNSTILAMRFFLMIIITVLLMYNMDGFSQSSNSETVLDEQEWRELVHEKKYIEEGKERRYDTPPRPPVTPYEPTKPPSLPFSFPKILQYLAYAMLIVILAFLIWFLISGKVISAKSFQTKKGDGDSNLDPGIRNPESVSDMDELQRLLQEALDQNLYQSAVRIRFIILLRLLDEKKLLTFKIDKTNWNYIEELSDTDHQYDFRKHVLIFEKVWYGGLSVDRNEFYAINNLFARVAQKIEVNEK